MKAITSNKWILLLVVFLVLTNLALVIFAFSGSKVSGRKEQNNYVKTALHLTDEQDQFFKKQKEEYFATMKPRWEEVTKLKDSLYQHLGDENISDSLINYYTDKWSEKSRASDILMFKHFRSLRSHCTQEQQAIFDTLIPKMVNHQSRKK
jgi:hypothetical protein